MSDVFLDTVGLIATWDVRDQWHAAADAAYQELFRQGRRLVTTTLILWECGNAAARRPYRQRVNLVRKYIDDAFTNDAHFVAAGFRVLF